MTPTPPEPQTGAQTPTDQTALRDRIRRAICEAEGFLWDTDMLEPDEYGDIADAVLAVLPEAVDRAARAQPTERPGCPYDCGTSTCPYLACEDDEPEPPREPHPTEADLRHADRAAVLLELETKYRGHARDSVHPDFSAAYAAVANDLRRMADEAPRPEGEAPEGAIDLADGPVRCPLCPHTVKLHTPNGARAHFTAVHPEQRLVGRGPWPLLGAPPAPEQAAMTEPADQAAIYRGLAAWYERGVAEAIPDDRPDWYEALADVARGLRRMADEEQQPDEAVHACPPDGSGLTPCCGRTPVELPLGDRISSEAPVTCPAARPDDTTGAEQDNDRPLSPFYSHETCGFHWHGRDGMDILMRDGQPICPRCEITRLTTGA